MKRFVLFILLLTALILAEYFLFSELFSEKRWVVLVMSVVLLVGSVVGLYRFVKKNNLHPRRTS